MTKKLHKTLENTKFAQCPVVAISANPNSEETNSQPLGIECLIEKLKEITFIPMRNADGPFLYAIDHCFNIKGQG
jgi:selenocysteine-specific elongation factor